VVRDPILQDETDDISRPGIALTLFPKKLHGF